MSNRILLLIPFLATATLAAQQPPKPPKAPEPARAPVAWSPAPMIIPDIDLNLDLPWADLFMSPDVPFSVDGPWMVEPFHYEPFVMEPFDVEVFGPESWPEPWPQPFPAPAPMPMNLEFQWNGQLPAPAIDVGEVWVGGARGGSLIRQAPDDSLYKQAREALNRGEYRRAADLFRRFEAANPGSRYLVASMYWRAFAHYRAGTEQDLRTAFQVLEEQQRRFPAAREDEDVKVLVTRVTGALASRGDADAARRLREGAETGAACDKERMSVRGEALSALASTDAGGVDAVLRRVLADRDECTSPLRRRAVYLIGKAGEAGASTLLLDVAKNDPDPQVRSDAIARLAQLPGVDQVEVMTQLLSGTTDERTQRAVVRGLRRIDDERASAELRRIIEREDLAERVRIEAIQSLVTNVRAPVRIVSPSGSSPITVRHEHPLSAADADYLRSFYGRVDSRALKLAVLQALARSGGPNSDQWLMALVRNPNEEIRYRSAALSRLRRSEVSIEELSRLYDTLTERDLRSRLVDILGHRTEPAATDKLLEIVRKGTDPSIQRAAITALARKNDPRTTKLLLELVEKP